MKWYEGLTDEQKDAASFVGMDARLLAGPGTGKTRSLTRRVLFLIDEKNVEPSKITVLTFTRAASAELKTRIKKALPEGSSMPEISTLHSFALKTLLKNPARDRLELPLRIADDFEEETIIYQDIKSILELSHIKEVRDLFKKLSAGWENLSADLDDWKERLDEPRFLGAWEEHRNIYGYVLRSELVYQLKNALIEGDLTYPPSIDYLLVDEYQDLNACDLKVVNMLSEYGAELFCAGDDDQSIYGFRYANPGGIRRFNNEYTPSESLELSTCMRCDKNILFYSLHVAKQDPRRIDKNLICKPDAEEGIVKILTFRGQRKEANGIADICKYLIDNKDINPSKILILMRSDKDRKFSKVLIKSLALKRIPVTLLSNPLEPLETDEGSILISILRLLINLNDNLAWRNILKISKYNNIGDVKISKIYKLASEQGIEFSEALNEIKNKPQMIPSDGDGIKNEILRIEDIINNINYDSTTTNLYDLIHDISNEMISDEQNRDEILEIFDKIIESNVGIDLEKMLNILFVTLSDKEQDLEEDTISIMTMHQAKGLTADAVFVVAAEDEYIPGIANGQEEIEDSRRLLYVSLTRAKHYLFITHCRNRTGLQTHSGSRPNVTRRRLSRFLRGGPIQSIPADQFIDTL